MIADVYELSLRLDPRRKHSVGRVLDTVFTFIFEAREH